MIAWARAVAATFGRFEILLHLAKTGVAEVSLVRDGWMGHQGRARVLKVLESHIESDGPAKESFVAMARKAATLRSPRIPATVEVGEIEGRTYVLQELVLGATLEQVLRASWKRGQPLSVGAILRIGARVLEALEAAHPEVHRAVSARSILVGWDGGARLTAFFSGALVYGALSPEQVKGKALDPRSDLWSLGVVLWEALAAKPLFGHDHMMQVLVNIMQKEIAPPSVATPSLPPDADAIVMKALAREPANRWRSAGEMREAIESLFARAGLEADDAIVQEELLALMGGAARAQVGALKRAMLGTGTQAELAKAFGVASTDPYEDRLPEYEDTRT